MYHTIYGRHSLVNGDCVEMYVDIQKLTIQIQKDISNILMVYNCGVTAKEMRDHGPHIHSALPNHELMIDCLGSWNMAHLFAWQIPTEGIDKEFQHHSTGMGYTLPNVGLDLNKNLSSVQKELLLRHRKLGISMQQVKELMLVVCLNYH